MGTRVKGVYESYLEMLDSTYKMKEELHGVGHALCDLGYYGYNVEAINNEWEIHKEIEEALEQLNTTLENALKRNC